MFVCERPVERSSLIINAHTGTLPSFLPEGNVVVQNTFTANPPPPVPALPDIPFAVEQTAQELARVCTFDCALSSPGDIGVT